jgi:hypothetical protein
MSSVDSGRWKLVTRRSTTRKLVADVGADEQRGGAGADRDLARTGGGALERAHDGGADRDHRAAAGDQGRGGGGHVVALDVHRVGGEIVDADRREGAEPDVQRDRAIVAPRAAIASSSAGVRCSPAVGAATAPGVRAKTVW